MRSPARSAERRQPAAARSPATPLLARQEPEEPWSPEAAAYEARLAELQRERQRAEREKARAEAEAYSTAATRLQAAERARGAKRRAREAADARAEEAAARDAAAARLQAAERGRTAKLETRRRRRRVEELGRGAARVAAKAEAAVARAAEAQAEEEAASPARALLRESRASRGSRGSPARKDDARGGDTARTPARKDRSPSSGRAARRRREVTPGEVSSAESLEGSDPRVATLRARPAASPPKPSAVASYLAQPAPTAPAAPTQPAPKPAGAACDRHGLKDCFLCSLQGASLTSPLPAPRPGCAVHGVADCPVCGVRGGIALPVAAAPIATTAAPASPEPCARHGLASCFLCSLRERGVGAAPATLDRPPELALGGAAGANRFVRGPASYYAPLLSATTPARRTEPAREPPRSEPRPAPPRDPVFAPRDPDRGPWHSPEARPMRVRPAVAPKRYDDDDDDDDEPVAQEPRRPSEPRRNAHKRKPRRAAGPYGSSSRPAPRRKTKAAAPLVPARAPRKSRNAAAGPPGASDALRAAKQALRGQPRPEFNSRL